MIDKTLVISPEAMLLFQAQRIFWEYAFPMLMGFVSVFCIQIYSRIGTVRDIKVGTAFVCSGFAAMVNLWGWAHMVRTPAMIPFYGLGVGFCAAVMSRIFAIVQKKRTPWKVGIPHVVWKGDSDEIEALKRRFKLAA